MEETGQSGKLNNISSHLKQYYRVDEVADYFSVSNDTIYRMICDGKIKAIKMRGCLRVPAKELKRIARQFRYCPF